MPPKTKKTSSDQELVHGKQLLYNKDANIQIQLTVYQEKSCNVNDQKRNGIQVQLFSDWMESIVTEV